MFCTSCGSQFSDQARFCPKCGAANAARTAPGTARHDTTKAEKAPSLAHPSASGASGKRRKWILAGIAGVAVAGLGISGGILAVMDMGDQRGDGTVVTSHTSPPADLPIIVTELSEFISSAQEGLVTQVVVDNTDLDYKLVGDDLTYRTSMERCDTVRSILQENGVEPGSADYPDIEIAGEDTCTDTPLVDEQAIRQVIDQYNQLNITSFRTWDVSGLEGLAIDAAYTELSEAVDQLRSANEYVDTQLTSFDIVDIASDSPNSATVSTLESWNSCTFNKSSGGPTQQGTSRLSEEYSLIRVRDQWYIESISITIISTDSADCGLCSNLAVGCGATVRNVAPENLFIRQSAGKSATILNRLPEGEVVCIAGGPSSADGLIWWELSSSKVSSGWSAQGDPSQPDKPWLVPTGNVCVGSE